MLLVVFLETRAKGEPPHRNDRGERTYDANTALECFALWIVGHSPIVTGKSPAITSPAICILRLTA
jgi:hypothetical protein